MVKSPTRFSTICEKLWEQWLAEKLDLPTSLRSDFDLNAMPEPYLRFNTDVTAATKPLQRPLIALTTNPGGVLPHQQRSAIYDERGGRIVWPNQSYAEAAKGLSAFYTTKFTGRALRRTVALCSLAEQLGLDGVFQIECCPFHSKSFPNKTRFVREVCDGGFLAEYLAALSEFIRLHPVIVVSAISSKSELSAGRIKFSEWHLWQAELMQFDLYRAPIIPLVEKLGRTTAAAIVGKVAKEPKAFVTMMGGNHLPAEKGMAVLADAMRGDAVALPDATLSAFEVKFNADFAPFKIRLPRRNVEQRKRGEINEAGWTIWYLFGSDERGEYLDYYAVHRMTNDRHRRIFATGRVEGLPAISTIFFHSSDPKENARLEAEFREENRKVEQLLKAKGFGVV